MQKPISFIIFYREQKKPREGVKPSRGIFVSAGSPAAESRDAERGKNAHTQMRQGWLLGDWIEVLNDAGDELQLHPFLHLLVDTAE